MYMQKRAGDFRRPSAQHISVPDVADYKISKNGLSPSPRKILFGTAMVALAAVCVILLNLLADAVFLKSEVFSPSALSGFAGNPVFEQYRGSSDVTLFCRGSQAISLNAGDVTVGELLNSVGIAFDEDDLINFPVDTPVESNMAIVFDEVEFSTSTEDIPFAFEITEKQVQTIPRGTSVTVRAGQNGLTRKTYRNRLVNGEVTESELIGEETAKEAVNEIREVGVGGVYTAADGSSYPFDHYIDVTATAYGKNDGASGDYTCTGALATRGVIAVDPNVIPLHTKVYIVGDYGDYGVNYAEDIGGGIKGKRIDICMDCSLEEMLQFGVRSMRVYILD